VPAFADIILADGQTTPVTHTFSPVTIDKNGVAFHADRSGGIALGYPTVSLLTRQPVNGSRAVKVIGKVVLPVLDVTSPSTATGIQPAPSKAFDVIFAFDFTLPERATLAQKSDVLAYARNLIQTTLVGNMVKDGTSIY